MKKDDVQNLAGMSDSALAKLGKNEPITLETQEKFSVALDCRIEDILEFVKETMLRDSITWENWAFASNLLLIAGDRKLTIMRWPHTDMGEQKYIQIKNE